MSKLIALQKARIQEWLAQPEHTDDEDIVRGARLALQCNRNQAMFNTIMRRPSRYVDRIRYELEKHLRYMTDGLTLDEVKALEKDVTKTLAPVLMEVESTTDQLAAAMGEVPEDSILPSPDPSPADTTSKKETIIARGKRGDHDQLPQEIQDIWSRNAERWKKIKQAFETCKSLTMACDRYEWLKVMKEAWYAYKADFAKYDGYVIGSEEEDKDEDAAETLSVDDLKAIALARPYISKNLPKLVELKAAATGDASTKKYNDLLQKVQERVDVLMSTKQVITDELRQQLADAGITFDTDGQRQEHSEDSAASE